MIDYTPIAQKSFGIDTGTGLEKRLHVWSQTNNVKNNTIEVFYDIVLISPTGKIVSVLFADSYTRSNIPATDTTQASTKFDDLKNSPLGQGIIALIASDLNDITSFDTIKEDLKQKVLPK